MRDTTTKNVCLWQIYGEYLRQEDLSCGNFRIFAAVQSVEDHGSVMDIGVKGVRAFLPRKATKSLPGPLSVGQVVPCAIAKSDGSSITLTADPKRVDEVVAKSPGQLTVHNLIPGTRVKAKVSYPLPPV